MIERMGDGLSTNPQGAESRTPTKQDAGSVLVQRVRTDLEHARSLVESMQEKAIKYTTEMQEHIVVTCESLEESLATFECSGQDTVVEEIESKVPMLRDDIREAIYRIAKATNTKAKKYVNKFDARCHKQPEEQHMPGRPTSLAATRETANPWRRILKRARNLDYRGTYTRRSSTRSSPGPYRIS